MPSPTPETLQQAIDQGYEVAPPEAVEKAISRMHGIETLTPAFKCDASTENQKCYETSCIDGWIYVSFCRNGSCKQWRRKRC